MPTDPANPSDEQGLTAPETSEERAAVLKLADTLREGRPFPSPGFRSRVRSSLFSGDRRRRPQVRWLIFGYAVAGGLLLGAAALGLAGAGPFAAG